MRDTHAPAFSRPKGERGKGGGGREGPHPGVCPAPTQALVSPPPAISSALARERRKARTQPSGLALRCLKGNRVPKLLIYCVSP